MPPSIAQQYASTRPAPGTGFDYTSKTGPIAANTYSLSAPNLISNGMGSYGQNAISDIRNRAGNALTAYNAQRDKSTQNIAADVVSKSGGTIPMDKYGLPVQTLTNYQDLFKSQLDSIQQRGQLATQTAEAKNAWQQANTLQNLNAGIASGAGISTQSASTQQYLPAGASSNNIGAQAVAMAMAAYNNHTPYVWGGNSLKSGIDCSGLVQQVYSKLGVKLPRISYQQAKSGHAVSLNQLQPGDLVFYDNPNDPNGVKHNAHVAIYMGNGQIVEAASTKVGMRVRSVGNAVGAVRPY